MLSYLAMWRRGFGSGLRGAAWSLLPIAAYLTGSIEMFWKMGVAVGDFAKGFVFSPRVWSGIALTGLAVALFIVSGPLRRRRVERGQEKRAARAGSGPAGTLAQKPAVGGQLATRPAGSMAGAGSAQAPAKARRGKSTNDDDDLGDVADILRRHGIT